nr:HD domain-containing phosphohydrolase [Chitinivorax sp. B]
MVNRAPTLLLVDDEANILASLRRLFRPHGYNVLTAGSGAEGIALLEEGEVDLIISDMRMPVMNGAQFLEKARQLCPNAIRILLTGFSEVSSTIDAINKGQIYRYIAKPWDDNEILMVVKQALEVKWLQTERARLLEVTERQNEELKQLNFGLEERVKERTQELEQAMLFLDQAHEKLKKSYVTTIKVFSNLIELRGGNMAGHSRRVAELARQIAIQMKRPEQDIHEIFLAGLLHDIGKIGLPDALLSKPFYKLSAEERDLVIKHPAKGQTALMALEQLASVGKLIRHHHERFDGLGFPDALAENDIPIGARILAVANEYDGLQIGSLQPNLYTPDQSLKMIQQGAGKRYDPKVVDALEGALAELKNKQGGDERILTSSALVPGMILARDLVTRDGVLLLARDYVLDTRIIEQIKHFEQSEGKPMQIVVQHKPAG